MTAEAPDPRTFKTWEDAFQHPIPVVRKLEQQLRNNANDNREKLRSLVGASYRDLLDTAETIITMSTQIQTVETNFARIGSNCNSQRLSRISRSVENSRAHTLDRDTERYTFASQLNVLRACPDVVSRLMKSSGKQNHLLVAKVLVISRLLHKALSTGKHKPPIVDHLRDKLGSLRSKLLRRIDARLAREAGEIDGLVETMAAYSLATSSTPSDVLRHFHHVRMERMVDLLSSSQEGDRAGEDGQGLEERGVAALDLCLHTVQDTQSIFPRQVSDALAKLKQHPLTQDPEIRGLYELNLDTHYRWIGDETRNYTPWPRHDELKREEAERMLHAWSKSAISEFLKGVKRVLGEEKDLRGVATLRQELVERWIVSGSRMAGVKRGRVLDDLREVVNGRLEGIVRSRTQNLASVVDLITRTLGSWSGDEEKAKGLELWNSKTTPAELGNGAQGFKQRILNSYHGRDEDVRRVMVAFDEWMGAVLEVKNVVKSMRETRWDDPFADDMEVSDSDEDEGDDGTKQILLSGDDPRLMEEATQDALVKAFSSLGDGFEKIVEELTEGEGAEKGARVQRVVFVLRVVREINDRIPRLRLQDKATPLATPFSREILSPLRRTLAAQIVHPVMESYRKSLVRGSKTRSGTHILWEGNPPLPIQPSPSAFRFMRDLVKRMGGYGADLWVPGAVEVLKEMAEEEIGGVWERCLEVVNKTGAVGKEPSPVKVDDAAEPALDDKELDTEDEKIDEKPKKPTTTDDVRDERWKQLVFDILYIQRFLSTTTSDANTSVTTSIYEAAGVDDAMQTRLKKSAGDYAKKTYLLFALLA